MSIHTVDQLEAGERHANGETRIETKTCSYPPVENKGDDGAASESRPVPSDTKDIEHAPVRDDPRYWSRVRKNSILVIVAAASMLATLGSNIYNPAINDIKRDLHASDAEIALSLSTFIIVLGGSPLFWSAVSEIKGRKKVYLTSELIFVVGCIIVATAKNIAVVIVMRCMQAFGGSAVVTIGAATLADVYEPHERGTMMGIFYAAPLLGLSMGPLLGGVLTQLFNWRATFWFLAIFGGLSLLSFVLFKDTFRRERSLTYQAALLRNMQRQKPLTTDRSGSSNGNSADASAVVSQTTTLHAQEHIDVKVDKSGQEVDTVLEEPTSDKPAEAENAYTVPPPNFQEIHLSLRRVNPITPLFMVLRRRNNLTILAASGFLFAFSYCIAYTCSRTLSNVYNYDALQIGLVLLSFGLGCMGGSVLGGRWSDRVSTRLKAENGGIGNAEMRLESTKVAMIFLPLSCIAYGWFCEKRLHIAAICVALFFAGFFTMWIYASTLAYIVDANTGRSSTAVATNSLFRGVFGFVAAEVAAPLQNAIGDGGLYTLWAALLVVSDALILLLIRRGRLWREAAVAKEAGRQAR